MTRFVESPPRDRMHRLLSPEASISPASAQKDTYAAPALKHIASGSSTEASVESKKSALPSSYTLSPAPPFCDAITICGTCSGSG